MAEFVREIHEKLEELVTQYHVQKPRFSCGDFTLLFPLKKAGFICCFSALVQIELLLDSR